MPSSVCSLSCCPIGRMLLTSNRSVSPICSVMLRLHGMPSTMKTSLLRPRDLFMDIVHRKFDEFRN